MHECMMPMCSKRADEQWAICGACWRQLPDNLRLAITRAFSPMAQDVTIGLQRALGEAQAWMVATFGGQAKEHDPGRWERLVNYVRARDASRAARRATEPADNTPSHLRQGR